MSRFWIRGVFVLCLVFLGIQPAYLSRARSDQNRDDGSKRYVVAPITAADGTGLEKHIRRAHYIDDIYGWQSRRRTRDASESPPRKSSGGRVVRIRIGIRRTRSDVPAGSHDALVL